MKIISVDRRRHHNVCVKTDDKDYLIDVETAEFHRLKADMLIDEEQLEAILLESEMTRAKNKALWLLQMRDHSAREMCEKLRRNYDKQVVEQTVELLSESGLIDDERFANMYAVELSEMRGMSRVNVRRELMRKGIGRELAYEITDNLPDDEVPAIIQIIKQKYYNCFEDEKAKRRMIAGLARKGYSFDDIKKAITEYTENERNID